MKPISEANVWQALESVLDPDLGIDIVNLGLVYAVHLTDSSVSVLMTLTTIGCPAQELLQDQVIAALREIEGVKRVRVQWTFDPAWSPTRMSEEGRDALLSLGFL